MNDERTRRILDAMAAAVAVAQSMGIGIRPRRYEGDPADLLQEGRTDFAPAVAITLYFVGPRERFAEGVVACWKEFVDAWGSSLRLYADETHGEWRPPTAKMLRWPIDRLAKRKPMSLYGWYAISAETYESASPVTFTAIVSDDAHLKGTIRANGWMGTGELSYVRATFPAACVAGEAAAAEILETTKRWCEWIPIRHGYAGLTVNEAAGKGAQQGNSGMLPQIAERFPGIEIDDCMGTSMVALDHIKGANWLTLLGGDFVERFGGLPALRGRLSEGIALHPLRDGGVIVQAGPAPTRGDTQTGDDLSLYREVARVLRPISLDSHPPIGTEEYGSFGAEGTNRWLRRFD